MLLTIVAVCVFSVAILIGLSVFSCTNVQAFIWPSSVSCGGDPRPPVYVVASVDEVLMRDGLSETIGKDGVATLEDIAREVSAETVVCALVQLRDSYEAPKDLPPPREYLARAARAQNFLDERHIAIVKAAPKEGVP